MAEQAQHTSAQDDQQRGVLNCNRGYNFLRELNNKDSSIWHRLIFCEKEENDDLQNAFCWLCNEEVLRGTPAYKCLGCYFLQHKSCVDLQPQVQHTEGIEWHHINRWWKTHHLIYIEEDLQGKGGEEKKDDCPGCKEPITIDRDPAYKCSMPGCTFLLHKSCGEVPTLIKHPLHDPHPDQDHILLLQELSTDHNDCSVCRKDCNGSFFYSCNVKGCRFNLHATCASLSRVNADDCQEHKLLPSRKQVHFTCESCGEETKDFACLCSECRVLIHGKCAQFQHTIKTRTHDHLLTRTYSSLSHQLDVFCRLCYKKLKTKHAAYYCCRDCVYVAHLDCANQVRDFRPPKEWEAVNSVDYQTHLVHLVEGINLAYDERVSHPEIQHFSHLQHNLILSNEKPIDDMRCEVCMQFIIFRAPFYGCTQCNFFLHGRCANLPQTIQRGIFHEHSLTLLSQAQDENGLFKCKACKRHRHGFVYNCSNSYCGFNLDVQCCLIPETLKHEGHQHNLVLARRSFENCNACGKDCQDQDVYLVCTNCNFTLCIRCATLPLVAKYRYDTKLLQYVKDLLQLSYTREDDQKEYYCVICKEELNHPDDWFYCFATSKKFAHSQCVLGDNPCIKFESTFISKLDHEHPFIFVQKTHDSLPCDFCHKPFYGVALKCTTCKFSIHTTFSEDPNFENHYNCLSRWFEVVKLDEVSSSQPVEDQEEVS